MTPAALAIGRQARRLERVYRAIRAVMRCGFACWCVWFAGTWGAPHSATEGALLLLAAAVYGPWQWFSAGLARRRILRNRDALADLAWARDLDEASDEYLTIRREIDNLNRFAKRLTWLRLVMFAQLTGDGCVRDLPIYRAMDGIADWRTRDKVAALVADSEWAVVVMLLMKSPMLVLFGALSAVPMRPVMAPFLSVRDLLAAAAKELGGLIQCEAACSRG
jgi:hypothetical protein